MRIDGAVTHEELAIFIVKLQVSKGAMVCGGERSEMEIQEVIHPELMEVVMTMSIHAIIHPLVREGSFFDSKESTLCRIPKVFGFRIHGCHFTLG